MKGSGCNAPNSDKYDGNTATSIFCSHSNHCMCLYCQALHLFVDFDVFTLSWIHIRIEAWLLNNFECTLTSPQVAENLAQLMYSVMMTGYMFRNAQFRLEMQQSLQLAALPNPETQEKVVSFFFPLHCIFHFLIVSYSTFILWQYYCRDSKTCMHTHHFL